MNEVKVKENENLVAHDELGMSRWAPWSVCGAWVGAGVSADAIAGTRCHAVLAECLRLHEAGDKHIDEAVDAMRLGSDYLMAGVAWAYDKILELSRGLDLHIEERVDLPGLTFGTVDCWWVDGDYLVVVDFKTFANHARDYTAQLAGYAWACMSQCGVSMARCYVLYGDDKDVVDIGWMDFETAREIGMGALRNHIRGTRCESSWCDVCCKRGECSQVLDVANKCSGLVERGDYKLTSADDAGRAMIFAERLDKSAKALKQMVHDWMDAGNGATGYKMQIGRGMRKVRPLDFWAVASELGVKAVDMIAEVSLSVASAESLLRGVGVSATDARNVLDAVCDRGEGAKKIVKC